MHLTTDLVGMCSENIFINKMFGWKCPLKDFAICSNLNILNFVYSFITDEYKAMINDANWGRESLSRSYFICDDKI